MTSASIPPGHSFGRYRILRLLGAGAMGEVYLAEDPSIERRLAIKTVRLGDGRPQERESREARLRREAKAAGRLLHPNIVTLFDVGEQDGLLYLAFEYVEGRDLDQRLGEEGVMSLGEVLAILRGVAQGLAYAHECGVVHRDIKPANLLLPFAETEGGRSMAVKISDFGIAKMMGQATELTSTGAVIGSPHYLSPEQVRGEPLDGRSDLFSLGVVTFEMLSGRRPFAGDTISTLVYQILHHQPPMPSALGPNLPPRLVQVVSKLLAKSRQERYVSAQQLLLDVEALEAELTPAQLMAPVVASAPAGPGAGAGETGPTQALPRTVPPPPAAPSAPTPTPASASAPVPPPPVPVAPGQAPSQAPSQVPSAAFSQAPHHGPVAAPPAMPAGTSPTTQGQKGSGIGRGLLIASLALAVVVLLALIALMLWHGRSPEDPVRTLEREASTAELGEPGLTTADGADGAGAGSGLEEGQELESSLELEELAPTPPPAELLDQGAGQEPENALGETPETTTSEGVAEGGEREGLTNQSPAGAGYESRSGDVSRQGGGPGTEDSSARSGRSGAAGSLPQAGADSVQPPRSPPGAERRQSRREGIRNALRDTAEDRARSGPGAGSGSGPGPLPDMALATGLNLNFRVTPEDAFLLIDGRMMGRVREYSGAEGFELPGPGRYRLVLRRGGFEDYRVLVSAAADGPAVSRISARLEQKAAQDVELGDLPLYRAREAVAFQVDHPQARLMIDGQPVGSASRFTNRLGLVREWLELSRGQHRVSIIAPGRQRVDLVVEITGGAQERRQKISVELPAAP
ncbi:MAG: serine/threonine-protein kinase [Acidobacteriota bacterium]